MFSCQLARCHFLRVPFHKNFPFVYDIGTVGDPERIPHVVVGEHDPDPPVSQFDQDFLKVDYGEGVDAREGFIQQEEFRIQCNQLLEWIILAGQYDDDTTPPEISIIHYGGEGHQEDPGYWNVTVEDLESGVDEVEIIIDGTTYLHALNLNGVQSITYTDIPVSLEEIISIGIHTIKVIARNNDFDTPDDQEVSAFTTGINIEAPPN